MFPVLYGDILELFNRKNGERVAIIQGCNCLGIFGAGLALQLSKAYPIIKRDFADKKLGNINVIKVDCKNTFLFINFHS